MNHKRNKRKVSVPKRTVEAEILEALAEFTEALESGDIQQRLNSRRIRLNLEPTAYSPELVKNTRNLMRLSQTLFARFLGVSPKTVRAWEQGCNVPHPMACRFMDEIRLNPQYWRGRFCDVAETISAREAPGER